MSRKPIAFRLPPEVDDWVAIQGGNAYCRKLVMREYERALARVRKAREAEKKK